MIGPRGENVTRLEGVDGGDPLDAAGDLVGHVVGVEVLLQLAVDPQAHLEVEGIGHLVGGDDVGAHGREGVTRLHLVEGIAGGGQPARRAVDEVGVAEDVAHGLLRLDARGALAHDEGHLGLALKDGGGHVREDHGVAVADDRARRLVEGVDGGGLGAGAVLHVVHGHAHDIRGPGEGRADAYPTEGRASGLGHRLFEPRAVSAEPGDEATDEVMRSGVGHALHLGGDVEDGIPLEHAQLEIVEEQELHWSLPWVLDGPEDAATCLTRQAGLTGVRPR